MPKTEGSKAQFCRDWIKNNSGKTYSDFSEENPKVDVTASYFNTIKTMAKKAAGEPVAKRGPKAKASPKSPPPSRKKDVKKAAKKVAKKVAKLAAKSATKPEEKKEKRKYTRRTKTNNGASKKTNMDTMIADQRAFLDWVETGKDRGWVSKIGNYIN